LKRRVYIKFVVALMLTSATLLTGDALAQAPATRDSQRKEVDGQGSRLINPEAAASDHKPSKPENNIEEPRPNDLKSEVETLKAENAAVRELLRKMAEQQKTLLEQVERLQRRLDVDATADVQPTGDAGRIATNERRTAGEECNGRRSASDECP